MVENLCPPISREHLPISDRQEAAELSVRAGSAFRPRAPISTREFFAGRWEQITTVADAVSQAGLHIVIFGERGVGKTSLANVIGPVLIVMEGDITGQPPEPRLVVKINVNQGDSFGKVWSRFFEEVSFVRNQPVIGIKAQPISQRITLKSAFAISDDPTIDDVRRAISSLPRSVFIFDEFDRGSVGLRGSFTDLIKALSDYAVDSTIVVVGVSDTVDDLIRDHASIVRAVVQAQLPRMNRSELTEILSKGAQTLGITFEPHAAELIVRMSQGLPHYTHLIAETPLPVKVSQSPPLGSIATEVWLLGNGSQKKKRPVSTSPGARESGPSDRRLPGGIRALQRAMEALSISG